MNGVAATKTMMQNSGFGSHISSRRCMTTRAIDFDGLTKMRNTTETG